MANVYVYSGAVGTGTGADWTNAYTTLGAALTAKAAGDTFYIAHDHAQSQAGVMALTSPGTKSSPCRILCVNRAGSVPPVSADLRTTGTLTITGSGDYSILGYVSQCYGLTFTLGGAGGSTNGNIIGGSNAWHWVWDTCAFVQGATTSNDGAALLVAGQGGSSNEAFITLKNCTLKFGSIGQQLAMQGQGGVFEWFGGSIDAGGSIPTTLFDSDDGFSGRLLANIVGVDLSAMGSGKNLTSPAKTSVYNFIGCKLGASVSVGGNPTQHSGEVNLINCDSGATNYRNEKWRYLGSQTPETTIVRTGGATDGTTPIATKIVTTANSSRSQPYTSAPFAVWNDTTGANVTVNVYGVWGGGAVPNNDDIWIEVWYMGSGLTPLFTINTANGPADALAAGTAQTTDASTWGGSTTKFKMTTTFSSPQPGMKGPLYAIVKAGKASTTFYIDAKPA